MNYAEHLFTCVAEEGGEITQAASKILRFAVDGHYPDGTSNIEALVKEVNDLMGVLELIQHHGIELPGLYARAAIEAKKQKVLGYLQVSKERGTLI